MSTPPAAVPTTGPTTTPSRRASRAQRGLERGLATIVALLVFAVGFTLVPGARASATGRDAPTGEAKGPDAVWMLKTENGILVPDGSGGRLVERTPDHPEVAQRARGQFSADTLVDGLFGVFSNEYGAFLSGINLMSSDREWLTVDESGALVADGDSRDQAADLMMTVVSWPRSCWSATTSASCSIPAGATPTPVLDATAMHGPIVDALFLPPEAPPGPWADTPAGSGTKAINSYFHEVMIRDGRLWNHQQDAYAALDLFLSVDYTTVPGIDPGQVLMDVFFAGLSEIAGNLPGGGFGAEMLSMGLDLAGRHAPGVYPDAQNAMKLSMGEIINALSDRHATAGALMDSLRDRIGADPERLGHWDPDSVTVLVAEIKQTPQRPALTRSLALEWERDIWRQILPTRVELMKLRGKRGQSCTSAAFNGTDWSNLDAHIIRFFDEETSKVYGTDSRKPDMLFVAETFWFCGYEKEWTIDRHAIGLGIRNRDGKLTPAPTAIHDRLFTVLGLDEADVACNWGLNRSAIIDPRASRLNAVGFWGVPIYPGGYGLDLDPCNSIDAGVVHGKGVSVLVADYGGDRTGPVQPNGLTPVVDCETGSSWRSEWRGADVTQVFATPRGRDERVTVTHIDGDGNEHPAGDFGEYGGLITTHPGVVVRFDDKNTGQCLGYGRVGDGSAFVVR